MTDLIALPLSRSFHRPDMLAGCERKLFLCAGIIAFLLGGVGLTWWTIAAAIAIWLVLVGLLRAMGTADPSMSAIYIRLTRYRAYYLPRPHATEMPIRWK